MFKMFNKKLKKNGDYTIPCLSVKDHFIEAIKEINKSFACVSMKSLYVQKSYYNIINFIIEQEKEFRKNKNSINVTYNDSFFERGGK